MEMDKSLGVSEVRERKRSGLCGVKKKWFKAMMKNNHFVVTAKQQIEVKIHAAHLKEERREMVLRKINNFLPFVA